MAYHDGLGRSDTEAHYNRPIEPDPLVQQASESAEVNCRLSDGQLEDKHWSVLVAQRPNPVQEEVDGANLVGRCAPSPQGTW